MMTPECLSAKESGTVVYSFEVFIIRPCVAILWLAIFKKSELTESVPVSIFIRFYTVHSAILVYNACLRVAPVNAIQ